jgi:hypothetical protein
MADESWVAQYPRSENPYAGCHLGQADAGFKSLGALRIGQCDVHHFGEFALLDRFC